MIPENRPCASCGVPIPHHNTYCRGCEQSQKEAKKLFEKIQHNQRII